MISTLKNYYISMYNNFAALSTFINLWTDTILHRTYKIESIK